MIGLEEIPHDNVDDYFSKADNSNNVGYDGYTCDAYDYSVF